MDHYLCLHSGEQLAAETLSDDLEPTNGNNTYGLLRRGVITPQSSSTPTSCGARPGQCKSSSAVIR